MKIDLFDYSTPLKWLDRLNRQYESLKRDPMNGDKALDFCLTAWSLADWDFCHRFPTDILDDQKRGKYRTTVLFAPCPELKMMHDIAIGAKHFVLTSKPKSNISSLEEKPGPMDPTFDDTFQKSCIQINFDDGSWSILNVTIRKVYEFWNQYLNKP